MGRSYTVIRESATGWVVGARTRHSLVENAASASSGNRPPHRRANLMRGAMCSKSFWDNELWVSLLFDVPGRPQFGRFRFRELGLSQ